MIWGKKEQLGCVDQAWEDAEICGCCDIMSMPHSRPHLLKPIHLNVHLLVQVQTDSSHRLGITLLCKGDDYPITWSGSPARQPPQQNAVWTALALLHWCRGGLDRTVLLIQTFFWVQYSHTVWITISVWLLFQQSNKHYSNNLKDTGVHPA